MIPDDSPLFNSYTLPKHFDDSEARLRCHLGQDAVPTLAGGRHLLYVCPVCKRPWYKAGRREYPRLTEEQLTHLGATFHADTQSMHLLPSVLCSICSTIYLDGIFTIEEYRPGRSLPHRGYHLLWERASAPYSSLVAMICRPASLPLRTLVQLEADTLTTPLHSVFAVLAWLERCRCPRAARVYTDEERQLLARRLPPGHGPVNGPASNQEPRIWCGYAWRDTCLPPGDPVLVSVAAAVDPLEPVVCARLLHAWRVLARAMRTVL